MDSSRKALWIAMSDMWLDTELSDESVANIAAVVRESGLSRKELDEVFKYELAPFLGSNQLTSTGEWTGFDPDWVCEQAAKRHRKRRLLERLIAWTGFTTYAARPTWDRVQAIALETAEE